MSPAPKRFCGGGTAGSSIAEIWRVNMSQQLYYVATAGFEAARRVEILPHGHRSRRLHGHSFLVRIRATLPKGWAQFPGCETRNVSEALTQCIVPLDYDILNNHLDVPTDENLARWVRTSLDLPG